MVHNYLQVEKTWSKWTKMGSVHHYLSDSHHAYSLIPIFSSLKTTTGHKKAWFLKLSLAPVSSACYSYPLEA